MRFLSGAEYKDAERMMQLAIEEAKKATCLRSRCGSIVAVNGKYVIGRGFNSPPGNDESQRRCLCEKGELHRKIVDKTCCIHAEHRAIMDAIKRNRIFVSKSKVYFVRLDLQNNMHFSGEPYCTNCSKLALDEGLSEFVLWREDGIAAYETGEYNKLSYDFSEGD